MRCTPLLKSPFAPPRAASACPRLSVAPLLLPCALARWRPRLLNRRFRRARDCPRSRTRLPRSSLSRPPGRSAPLGACFAGIAPAQATMSSTARPTLRSKAGPTPRSKARLILMALLPAVPWPKQRLGRVRYAGTWPLSSHSQTEKYGAHFRSTSKLGWYEYPYYT